MFGNIFNQNQKGNGADQTAAPQTDNGVAQDPNAAPVTPSDAAVDPSLVAQQAPPSAASTPPVQPGIPAQPTLPPTSDATVPVQSTEQTTQTTVTQVAPVTPVESYTVGTPNMGVTLQVPSATPVPEVVQTTTTTQTTDGTQPPQTSQPVTNEVATPNAPAAPDAVPSPNAGTPVDPALQKRESMSAMSRLDPRMTQVLHQAQEEAKRIKQQFIEPDQLLFGLIYDGEIFKLMEQFSLDAAKMARDIQAREQPGEFTGEPTLSDVSKQVLDDAYTNTKNRGASFITPEDTLVAIFSSAVTADFLKTQGLEKGVVEQKLSKTAGFTTARVTMLDKFGVDLTQEAANGELDPVTGRDKETERLIHILLRRTKNNPIIIGEPGVGKTAIVENLAQKIVSGQVPEALKDRKIIQLDIASLIAGASHRGEFEERLRGVIKEVQAAEGKIVLFIDEIHTLVGAGDTEGALDASNIIKPFLARGQLQVIGTTTTAEYRKYFQKDKAFERRFQSIVAEEPTEEVAVEMMNAIKGKYEQYHNVVFLPEAVEGAVHLSKKYIGERFLPDKAVDLIDEAAAEVKLEINAGTRQDNQVNKADIEKVVSSWTGIPITRLTEDESEKLLHLEDLIHKRLIDQEQAVAAVAEAVRRGRIGLAAANRPIASFMFLGPTGVGKTELAKTLAEIMFGRDDAMVRLDMSEYMEKHEVAKLIGAPPGYVGYEEGGQLTEAVRAKPYSIVLLDEVEKAHPDVFNILLQLLEDGRLTDNKGNTVSFKNTIIIATSNLGSALIQKYLLDNTSGKASGNLFQDAQDGETVEGDKKTTDQSGDTQTGNVQAASPVAGDAQSNNDQTKDTAAAPSSPTQASNASASESTDVKNTDAQNSQPAQSDKPADIQVDAKSKDETASKDSSSAADGSSNQDKTEEQGEDQPTKKGKQIDFQMLNKILLEELHKFFRPELLNRFDELVVFKPLSQDDMSSIAKLGIDKTAKLLKDQGFTVEVTDKALAVLAKEGYDPIYGARPLRRLIQSSIENPIALQIIGKQFMANDIIQIDYDDVAAQFVFTRKTPPEENGVVPPAPDGSVPQPPQDDTQMATSAAAPGVPETGQPADVNTLPTDNSQSGVTTPVDTTGMNTPQTTPSLATPPVGTMPSIDSQLDALQQQNGVVTPPVTQPPSTGAAVETPAPVVDMSQPAAQEPPLTNGNGHLQTNSTFSSASTVN